MVSQALEAGASGFFSKSDANNTEISEVVRTVYYSDLFISTSAAESSAKTYAHELGFSKRPLEALQLIADHPTASNAELAVMMGVTESTFSKHLTVAMKRTGTPKNRLAAVTIARVMGII